MSVSFHHVERGPAISKEEAAEMMQPYRQQEELIAFLNDAWEHSAEILRAHGYEVTKMGAPPITQDITEPKALEAEDVIGAIHNVWSALFKADEFTIANAGIWLGLMAGGESFRKYQKALSDMQRNSPRSQDKAERLSKAREIAERLRSKGRKPTYHDIREGLRKAGLACSDDQARDCVREMNKAG